MANQEKCKIKKNSKLLNIARTLRRNLTNQEKHLWYDYLRYYPIKIYKQRIIDNYIVDFYCHKARLAIELDGSQHYSVDGKNNDGERTKNLEKYRIEVMRFSNFDVDEKFEGVCDLIDKRIKERVNKQD